MQANLAIIGGGPAGLKAAEVAAQAGAKVHLYEGKPSVGRKFLVAGHGGLNLTHSEPLHRFASRYAGGFLSDKWTSFLQDFSNEEMRVWAKDLGTETFIGTSGRVFPKEFKAAPLLRSWVRRLRSLGVVLKTRHSLQQITPGDGRFILSLITSEGEIKMPYDAVILALGGASWPKTGSDARWVNLLQKMGISITPLLPANCGWQVNWDLFIDQDIFEKIEGHPLKNITVTVGHKSIAGELLVTKYGLEGGALYQLGSYLRKLEKPILQIDLKPSLTAQELASKISKNTHDLITMAAKAWRLSPAAKLLLLSFSSSERQDHLSLARLAKNLKLPLAGPRPIAEAISSAGGVCTSELDDHLMVKRHPGLFLAGEMIDWEAPTGGYLLQGCFATGARAAQGALSYLENQS